MDIGRRDAADRRLRGLPRAAQPVRLPLRPADAAGVRRPRSRRRSAWSTPRARTSACCARCRSSSTRASREPILIGRADVIAPRIERLGLRIQPGSDCRGRQLRRRSTRYATTGASTTSLPSGGASRARLARSEMRRSPTLIAAHAGAAGDADAHDVRHLRPLSHASRATCAR